MLVTGGSSNSENGQELVYSIKVPSADKVNELKQLGKMLTTPVLDNTIITSAVCENGVRYLNGEISLDEAAKCSHAAGEPVSGRIRSKRCLKSFTGK